MILRQEGKNTIAVLVFTNMFVFTNNAQFLQNGIDPLITRASFGVRILSNATHDISFESTSKIWETLDAP